MQELSEGQQQALIKLVLTGGQSGAGERETPVHCH